MDAVASRLFVGPVRARAAGVAARIGARRSGLSQHTRRGAAGPAAPAQRGEPRHGGRDRGVRFVLDPGRDGIRSCPFLSGGAAAGAVGRAAGGAYRGDQSRHRRPGRRRGTGPAGRRCAGDSAAACDLAGRRQRRAAQRRPGGVPRHGHHGRAPAAGRRSRCDPDGQPAVAGAAGEGGGTGVRPDAGPGGGARPGPRCSRAAR